MNIHLKNQFVQTGRSIFSELQQFQRVGITKSYNTIVNHLPHSIDFWNNVAEFFNTNNAKDRSITVPCSYVEDSSSVGRHRQHCYISDKDGNRFQIDAMFHRRQLNNSSYELPLGALVQALIKKDISGSDDWFKEYSNHINKKLFSSLNALNDDLDSMPSLALDNIKSFYSDFFFWNVYNPSKSIDDYHYDGMPELKNLLLISANITEETIPDFKREIKILTQ